MNDCLHESYQRRDSVPKFDDTPLKDEWQLPVYIFAKGVYDWCHCTSVVDIGCGSAYKLVGLFPHNGDRSVIGVENNANTLDFLKRYVPSRGFWTSPEKLTEFLNHPDIASDIPETLLICSDVIEHVEDPVVFMEYLLSIPWTNAIISTPIRHDEELDGPPGNIHHYREWGYGQFFEFLNQWDTRFEVKLHIKVDPQHRTQMAWLERKSEPDQETESHSGGELGESTSDSGSSSLGSH